MTATDRAGNTFSTSTTFTVVNPAFASLTSTLKVDAGENRKDDFRASGDFTLATLSNGINPVTDGLSIQLAGGPRSVSVVVPSGALRADGSKTWKFDGNVSGIKVEVELRSLGGARYSYKVQGEKVALSGLTNPVLVTVSIGDDSGIVSVTTQPNGYRGDGGEGGD